jgi:hypothetical protein
MMPPIGCWRMTKSLIERRGFSGKPFPAQLLPDSFPLHPNEEGAVQIRVSPYLATADRGDDTD